jgi:hypothetical protein
MQAPKGRKDVAPTHWPRHWVGGGNGQRDTSAALYPWELTPGTHWIGGWVCLRAGLNTDARGKVLCPAGNVFERKLWARTESGLMALGPGRILKFRHVLGPFYDILTPKVQVQWTTLLLHNRERRVSYLDFGIVPFRSARTLWSVVFSIKTLSTWPVTTWGQTAMPVLPRRFVAELCITSCGCRMFQGVTWTF